MSEFFLGEIQIMAGGPLPSGFLPCDGRQLNVQAYPALFSLISNYYGGDGVTNFRLPNLTHRAAVGQGTGPGLSSRVIGQSFGEDAVALGADQMPVHTHDLYCWNGGRAGAGRQDDPPSGGAWLGNPQNSLPFVQVSVDTDDEAGVGVGSYPLSPNAVQNIGAGAGHENRQPFVAMSYIICVIGTQPTFSN